MLGTTVQTKTKRLKKETTPRDLSHWERMGGKNMKVTGNRKREGHRSISLHRNILPLCPILSCFSVCHATGTSRDEGTKANILSRKWAHGAHQLALRIRLASRILIQVEKWDAWQPQFWCHGVQNGEAVLLRIHYSWGRRSVSSVMGE